MLRIDGALTPVVGVPALDPAMVEHLFFRFWIKTSNKFWKKIKNLTFVCLEIWGDRVNAFHERGNFMAALRLIPNEIKNDSGIRNANSGEYFC